MLDVQAVYHLPHILLLFVFSFLSGSSFRFDFKTEQTIYLFRLVHNIDHHTKIRYNCIHVTYSYNQSTMEYSFNEEQH